MSGGTLGTIFIGLGVMLVDHWLRKLNWRKYKRGIWGGAADELEAKTLMLRAPSIKDITHTECKEYLNKIIVKNI